MHRRWFRVGVIVAVVALLLVGIRLFAGSAVIANPDAVQIVVTEEQPSSQRQAVIFDHQFSRQATDVYTQLVSGGPLSVGAACPAYLSNQPYYHYELTFFHWGVKTATATSDALGCMYFDVRYLLGIVQSFSWRGAGGVSFWIKLHQLVNAPEPIGICMTIPNCHS